MFFDTYASTTDPSSLKGKLPPIKVNDSPGNVFDSLMKYLKDEGYENLTCREDYYDLFGIKDEFEVSFVVANSENKSLIQISVYSEKKKGRVKRRLRQIYSEIEERFQKFI